MNETRSQTLELECGQCGRVTVLDAPRQALILTELTRSAQRKIIECGCGTFQFVLEAKAIRRREQKRPVERGKIHDAIGKG